MLRYEEYNLDRQIGHLALKLEIFSIDLPYDSMLKFCSFVHGLVC